MKHLNRRDNGPLIESLMCEMCWCLLIFLVVVGKTHIRNHRKTNKDFLLPIIQVSPLKELVSRQTEAQNA